MKAAQTFSLAQPGGLRNVCERDRLGIGSLHILQHLFDAHRVRAFCRFLRRQAREQLRIAVQKQLGGVLPDGKFIRKRVRLHGRKGGRKPLDVRARLRLPDGKIRAGEQRADVVFIKHGVGSAGDQKRGKHH